MTFSASLFTFISVLKARVTVSSALYAVRTLSLQVVAVDRGKLSEAFLWVASAIWFLTFMFMTWVRLWNIADMRATKEKEEERIKATEAAIVAANRRRLIPLRPVLQQSAAAQM
jgi:uncharacterized membrane protein